MKLIKKENKYSANKFEYEVLERGKVEEIIDNLNRIEVSKNLIEKAVEYSGRSAYAFAELNIENGEIYYCVEDYNTETIAPNLYVRIMNFGDLRELRDVPDEYLLDEEELEQVHKLTDANIYGEDALEICEAFEKFIKDNKIDMEDRLREYCLEAYWELDFYENIKEGLDEVYMEE